MFVVRRDVAKLLRVRGSTFIPVCAMVEPPKNKHMMVLVCGTIHSTAVRARQRRIFQAVVARSWPIIVDGGVFMFGFCCFCCFGSSSSSSNYCCNCWYVVFPPLACEKRSSRAIDGVSELEHVVASVAFFVAASGVVLCGGGMPVRVPRTSPSQN